MTSPAPVLRGGELAPHLLWLDLEFGGLQIHQPILEIAAIVTTRGLKELARFHQVIHYEPGDLKNLDAWSKQQHRQSGLLAAVARETCGLAQAVTRFGAFLDQYRFGAKLMVAGSSVAQDLHFIRHHMPQLVSRFTYKTLDVTTFLNAAQFWAPYLHASAPRKATDHRAMGDIESSLNLMRFYFINIFAAAQKAHRQHGLYTWSQVQPHFGPPAQPLHRPINL